MLFYHIGWGFGILILLSLSWLFDFGRTGRGSMDFARRHASKLFKNSVEWQNKMILQPYIGRKVVFLAVPSITGIPVFWSFGWHGDETLSKMDVLYTVPKILLCIPFLREMLVASGAVEDDKDNILWLLKKEGRSICYSPGKMQNVMQSQSPDRVNVNPMDLSFVAALIEKDVVIIPVVFQDEIKRYPLWPSHDSNDDSHLMKYSWLIYVKAALRMVQRKSYSILGYPFPLIFGLNMKYNVTTSIGAPIDTRNYTQNDVLKVNETIESGWVSIGQSFDSALLITD